MLTSNINLTYYSSRGTVYHDIIILIIIIIVVVAVLVDVIVIIIIVIAISITIKNETYTVGTTVIKYR